MLKPGEIIRQTCGLCLCLLWWTVYAAPLCACERSLNAVSPDKTDQNPNEARARSILTEAGFCVEIIARGVSLPKRLLLLETGHVDVVWGIANRPERQSYALFSQAMSMSKFVLVVKAERYAEFEQVQSMRDVLNSHWVMSGALYGWGGPDFPAWRAQLESTHRFRGYRNTREGMIDVARGRSDVMTALSAEIIATDVPERDQLRVLPMTVYAEPIYMGFSKKSFSEAELLRVNDAIALLKKRGIINDL